MPLLDLFAPIGPVYANTLLAEDASEDSAFPAVLGIDRWAARLGASSAQVTVTARNLLTWTDYAEPEPEASAW